MTDETRFGAEISPLSGGRAFNDIFEMGSRFSKRIVAVARMRFVSIMAK